jgi:hypothetical protein
MRIVNGVLCLLMLAFVAVQYNDPDAGLWMVIYGLPAAWAALAAWRPARLQARPATLGLGLCLLAALAGVAYWWPTDAGWWRQEVWWESETAREGMGLMAVAIVLAVVALTGWLGRGKSADVEQAAE